MFPRLITCVTFGAMTATAALATGTVTLTLESPAAGQTVPGGATVNWTIKVSVSTGDNYGLALLACDLVQAAANPAKLDLPPGDAATIPTAMAVFNRPAGITNPGEGGAPSGFIGVQRGSAGERNLVQIGGGQNTFGTAMPPGSGIGENALVSSGIGQGAPQLVLSGSFPAPTTNGSYTFSLQNGTANVLTSVGAPPQFSQCTSATVDLAGASFTFTVGTTICVGDLNCDGVISFADINPFVTYLSNFTGWQAQFPGCDARNGDVNCDGVFGANSFGDINPFVSLMTQCGSGCACPGPVSCP
jgi:hypothetical protein